VGARIWSHGIIDLIDGEGIGMNGYSLRQRAETDGVEAVTTHLKPKALVVHEGENLTALSAWDVALYDGVRARAGCLQGARAGDTSPAA